MIEYVKGDITEVADKPNVLLVHGVNCRGVMASGVAKAIREKWPRVYENYRIYFNGGHESRSDMLGRCSLVITDGAMDGSGPIVINAFTQEFYGREPGRVYVSYEAIDKCFKEIAYIQSLNEFDVYFPKIGAGLGGGDWEKISHIINRHIKNGICVELPS